MFDALFVRLATSYRAETYMAGAKAAGILCSFADIVMIWMFLRLADSIRGRNSGGWRYRTLILFALLTPALLIPKTSTRFFVLQFFVLGLPYLILAYAVVTDIPHILAYIRQHVDGRAK